MGPVSGSEIDRAEHRIGRAGSNDLQAAVACRQQHCRDREQARDFIADHACGSGRIRGGGKPLAKASDRGILMRRARADIGLAFQAPGKLGGDDGDTHENQQCHNILRIADGEGVERRQEEEIIRQRRDKAGDQRRAQAEQGRGSDDGYEIEKIDAVGSDPWLGKPREAGHTGDHGNRDGGRSPGPSTGHRAGVGRAGRADGHDMYGNAIEIAHQPIDNRSMAKLEPPRPPGFADYQRRRPRLAQIAADAGGDIGGRHRGDGSAERRGELERRRHPVARHRRQTRRARGFNRQRRPRRIERIGEAFGGADQCFAAGLVAHGDNDAFSRRPLTSGADAADMVEHLPVDGFGGTAQGQFAQRRQVRLGKEMPQRPAGFLGHIDLAGLEAFDQFVGRQVDQFEIGVIENGVGHSLAHADLGEAGDDIIEAFDMLDVDRCQHVDAGVAQLLDVLPALGVATARRIAVREFIDQRDLRRAGEQRVDIEFGERMRAVLDLAARHDFERCEQRFGVSAAVGLDQADDNIATGAQQLSALAQHLEGLADAGGGAEQDLQLAAAVATRGAQQQVGRGSIGIAVGHGASVAVLRGEIRSSSRLSANTLTRGSPRNPSSGEEIAASTSAVTCASGMARAAATRAT